MLSALGPEKYKFFFDKFLGYFFTSIDAKFFASLGVNCLRVPFNHRHFEDDMNPGVYKNKDLNCSTAYCMATVRRVKVM
jgi:hypothetical protein